MSLDYRLSHQGLEKACSYDSQFSSNPYRSMMWELEKEVLDDVLRQYPGIRNALDFACGTGRISKHLDEARLTVKGVDVSAGMLAIAKERAPDVHFVCDDITVGGDVQQGPFGIVTAFRFFPNAQVELRAQAMSTLARLLASDGVMVFNNHKNKTSLTYTLARLFFRRDFGEMSHAEVVSLMRSNGLREVASYHLGVFPSNDRIRLLPLFILKRLERLFSRISMLRPLASNVIYLCQRDNSRSSGGAPQ